MDDDSAVQRTIRLLLEQAGHRVVTANDGSNGSRPCDWSTGKSR